MAARSTSVLVAIAVLALSACEEERRAPTAPSMLPREAVVLRFERSGGPTGPDEILTATGLGHVTYREIWSGAVARIRISIDELLALERAFDDAGLDELPDTIAGDPCAACPTVVLTRGVGAGERSVVLTGDPADQPPAVRQLIDRLSVLAARAVAARQAATGGGGTARERLPSGLEVALAVGDATTRPGEPLYLQLVVSNPTDRPIRLIWPSSLAADFRIETLDGDLVWSLSEARAVLSVPSEFELDPGESRTFEEVWLGRTSEGDRALPGSYLAVGVLPAAEGGETPPVAFQIR